MALELRMSPETSAFAKPVAPQYIMPQAKHLKLAKCVVASWEPLRVAHSPTRKAFNSSLAGSQRSPSTLRLQRRNTVASASSASSSPGSSESKNLALSYAGLAAIFAASAAARLASPQFYAGLAHDACPNGLAEALIRLSGATLIPIAAALWTLKGAADHDRLSSNTYRRVNLGLAAWAAASLALLAKGAASHVVTWCSGLQTAVYVSLIAACSYAWSTSTGYAPTGRQIIDGVTDDIRALFKNSSWLSGALSLLSVIAAGAGILTLAEPFQYFQPEAFRVLNGVLGAWYMRSYSTNLLFVAVVLTTLKDALDRGRHTASTFRLLAQAGLAASLAEMAIFYSTGQDSGLVREAVIAALLAAYLAKD